MKIDDTVAWTWGSGLAEGTVEQICPERTEIESKGAHIVRSGTPDNPAIIIRHASGSLVLKLRSELQVTGSK